MHDQRAMLEGERAEMREKLRNLRAYAATLRQRVAEHDCDEEHFGRDLMRAENDAAYYEAEIGRLTDAMGRASGRGGSLAAGLSQAGGVPLAAASVAFAAGLLLGWTLLPRRDGR